MNVSYVIFLIHICICRLLLMGFVSMYIPKDSFLMSCFVNCAFYHLFYGFLYIIIAAFRSVFRILYTYAYIICPLQLFYYFNPNYLISTLSIQFPSPHFLPILPDLALYSLNFYNPHTYNVPRSLNPLDNIHNIFLNNLIFYSYNLSHVVLVPVLV